MGKKRKNKEIQTKEAKKETFSSKMKKAKEQNELNFENNPQPKPAEEKVDIAELPEEEQKVTLDVLEKERVRRLTFNTEEEKRIWNKMNKKRKLNTPYFLLGVGINFLLYWGGVDLSQNISVGAIVGLGVPLATMFIGAELHYRFFMQPKEQHMQR